MSKFASIIGPESPIPEPPELKWLSMLVAFFCAMGATAVIVFILVEFTMDMVGKPIELGDMPRESESQPRVKRSLHEEIDNELTQFTLLSPLDKTRVPGNEVTVLCTWSASRGQRISEPPFGLNLLVDDFLVPWDIQLGNNTWFAKVVLTPGIHHIRTSVFDVQFEVGNRATEADSRDWPDMKTHSGLDRLDRCGDCHEWVDRSGDRIRRGRGITLGAWKGAESSCLHCHPEADWQRKHEHPLEPLEDCRQCHVLHGTRSQEKSLLRAPPADLCAQCHESP